METVDLDVVIVGAGLSGIAAAHWLQTSCPTKTFALLEARDAIGGTWDLFRYPGIRSDSDMYTLGYSFRPWRDAKAIADGPSILKYIRDTASEEGIDRKIRFRTKLVRADWSSDAARWNLTLDEAGTERTLTCRFLYFCSGYYDYAAGYTPEFTGRERYRGRVIHPQHWPSDATWDGKRVVVIGSGATAITLVPELAERAAHVTMLQRSPSYLLNVPERDKFADFVRDNLPEKPAHAIARWKNVLVGMAFFNACRRFPERAQRFLTKQVKDQLGPAFDPTHFTPRYAPWDQRMCFVPDADFFAAMKAGKASIVTDVIETFTERGLRLASGTELEADVVVTATGFKVQLLGGAAITIDGAAPSMRDVVVYKGMMFSGIPNFAIAVGYTNASWTLKAELTSRWVCRVLNHMDAHRYVKVVPRVDARAAEKMPLLDFSSGYVQRAAAGLPQQGTKAPWRLYQNYVLDLFTLRAGKIEDPALEFG
jgi:cation diffusion facilitator CzcD-associated flavoprotein CzcO